jgi:hypothetical protein
LWGIVKFKLYKNYITIVNIFGGVYIYDVIVIGTGAGGATVAKDLSQYGKDVLILEKGSRKRQGSYVQHMKTKKIHLKNNLSDDEKEKYEFLTSPLELTNIEEIGGTTTSSIGNACFSCSGCYTNSIMQQFGDKSLDIFEEPQKTLRRKASNAAMRKFFVEGMYDENDTTKDAQDFEDLREQAEAQFENDVEAMYEHVASAEYNPIVGMALPIHKLILMNNVYDKGGIQKVTAVQPKFTISLERRILVKPDGTEIDMFLQQNEITDAINSTNPVKEIELTLPVTETKDIITDEFGGTALDNLDVSTYICAVKVKNVFIEAGDILPNDQGYIEKDGEIATEDTTADVWFHTDIHFTPNYGGLAFTATGQRIQ